MPRDRVSRRRVWVAEPLTARKVRARRRVRAWAARLSAMDSDERMHAEPPREVRLAWMTLFRPE